MSKIKLTKGELKRQRDSLEQFLHYLPTLQLKKQQLQMKIVEARKLREEKKVALDREVEEISRWTALLAETNADLKAWIVPESISLETMNIAGANIPIFKDIRFPQAEYDLYTTPLWVDRAIEELRLMVALFSEIAIVEKRIEVLQKELRITTQRVNLFEKIKIPECLENIRAIRIYLGDQQANAVGVSKVAKKKIMEYETEMVSA
ncbi:MAG TPA: V-type ATP synthase subunit D [Candidatus Omnitrophota bacterium]|nr:V-type ATP synthase subunit D [Candidatus Omnitrophota bacterium]